MHTMSFMEMHSHKKEGVFNMHAWSRERCMCVHVGGDLYTSTFEPENKRDKLDIQCPGWFKDVAVNIDFLFLFLPRKENINDVIGLVRSWDFLCLCALGWGPPEGARLQRKRCLTHRLFRIHHIYDLRFSGSLDRRQDVNGNINYTESRLVYFHCLISKLA
jgi:hypothetical protein